MRTIWDIREEGMSVFSTDDRTMLFNELRYHTNSITVTQHDPEEMSTDGFPTLRDVTVEIIPDWLDEVGADYCAGRDPDWTERPWLAQLADYGMRAA